MSKFRVKVIVNFCIAGCAIVSFCAMLYKWKNTDPVRNIITATPPTNHLAAEQHPRPEYERSSLTKVMDARLEPLVNNVLPLRIRIPDNFVTEVPAIANPHDLKALEIVLLDATDNDAVRNEVANLLRRSKYQNLPEALIKVLQNPEEKPRFRAFATQHLGGCLSDDFVSAPQKQVVHERLQAALQDKDTEVRQEALFALVQVKDKVARETASTWLTDKGADLEPLRHIAIRCVQEMEMKDLIPAIRPYLTSADEATRIQAIVTLSEWGDEESRSAFQEAANSSVVRLQRAGSAALKRLDSMKAPANKP